MKKVLTIAGSDCSGGAGIQADLKTITAHKLYGMSVITALTAQNTTGVYDILEATPEFVAKQLDCIFKDIRPDAIKVGMVSNYEIIEVIANKLVEYEAKNIVVDPVMMATSGSRLLNHDAMDALINKLLPLATIITPNLLEAEALCQMNIHSKEEMVQAAQLISSKLNGAVLIKGGHSISDANDLLYVDEQEYWFNGERVLTENTHGTGCTLSSAIACHLAVGRSLQESVKLAKEYITGALKQGMNLGHGNGPLDHTYIIK